MLIGFVSAGLLSFRQSLGVILGADIGTTLTVQLLAFNMQELSLLLVGARMGMDVRLCARSASWRECCSRPRRAGPPRCCCSH